VLAKGLIGIVLPGLVLVAWLLVAGRPLQVLRLLSLPGLLLFGVVAAPWFLAMQRGSPSSATNPGPRRRDERQWLKRAISASAPTTSAWAPASTRR
jgi:4-amino-4-deoxy-L-arabinose transferase-like glycosyltransferase